MREEVIWSLPDPGCRRCKCFYEVTEKEHEYSGRADGLITLRREFKTCGRWRYGCPPHRVELRRRREIRKQMKRGGR